MCTITIIIKKHQANITNRKSVLRVSITEPLDIVEDEPSEGDDHEDNE